MTSTRAPCVYIMAGRRDGPLYIGVTSNLVQRIGQHKIGVPKGHTDKYDIRSLVWYELHSSMESAISREKAMKKWRRAWKIALIEETNPRWTDLYGQIL